MDDDAQTDESGPQPIPVERVEDDIDDVDDVDDDLITTSDVANLNLASVERSAALARLMGAALVVVGVVGAAGWGWLQWRTQDQASENFGFGGEDLSIGDRLDLLVNTLVFLIAAGVALAVGLLTRLVADYAQSRVGGSVTGFRVGDRFHESP